MKFTHESEAIAWALFASGCLQQPDKAEPAERAAKVATMADAMMVHFRQRLETPAERDARYHAESVARRSADAARQSAETPGDR